eukprot:912746-Prymnesium_polylepis.1
MKCCLSAAALISYFHQKADDVQREAIKSNKVNWPRQLSFGLLLRSRTQRMHPLAVGVSERSAGVEAMENARISSADSDELGDAAALICNLTAGGTCPIMRFTSGPVAPSQTQPPSPNSKKTHGFPSRKASQGGGRQSTDGEHLSPTGPSSRG